MILGKLADGKKTFHDTFLEVCVLSGVHFGQRRPKHGDRLTARFHRRQMCGRVDTASQTAHYDRPLTRQRPRKVGSHRKAFFGGSPSPDHGNSGVGERKGHWPRQKHPVGCVLAFKLIEGAQELLRRNFAAASHSHESTHLALAYSMRHSQFKYSEARVMRDRWVGPIMPDGPGR